MDGPSARRRDRGGEGIPSLRASRLRLTLGLLALALGLALAAYPLADGGHDRTALLPLAGLGLLGLFFAATGSTRLLGLALAGLAAELVTHQLATGSAVAAAIGYGAGLLVLAELVSWATGLEPTARIDVQVVRRRASALAGTALLGAAAATAALVGGSISGDSALAAACVGVLGSLGLLGLVRALS